jgi:hypothetical protein
MALLPTLVDLCRAALDPRDRLFRLFHLQRINFEVNGNQGKSLSNIDCLVKESSRHMNRKSGRVRLSY